MEELNEAKKKFKHIEFVLFQDDNFTSDEPWLNEFSRRYAGEINLPYNCITHPLFVNEQVVRALKYSGCGLVELGVQSMNEEIRRKVLRRHETNLQVEKALDILNDEEIFVGVDYIITLPGESLDDLVEFAKLLNRYSFILPRIYKLAYFPNTDITKMVLGDEYSSEGMGSDMIKSVSKKPIFDVKHASELSGRIGIDSRYIDANQCSVDMLRLSFFLTSLLPILPGKVNRVIIEKGLYDIIPNNKYLHDIFYCALNPVFSRIKLALHKKSGEWIYFGLKERLHMYYHFILQRE
jgi:radical SAM superfamily enzyme YgiQ (UPF0313 family)